MRAKNGAKLKSKTQWRRTSNLINNGSSTTQKPFNF